MIDDRKGLRLNRNESVIYQHNQKQKRKKIPILKIRNRHRGISAYLRLLSRSRISPPSSHACLILTLGPS